MALLGIFVAYRFYVARPGSADALAHGSAASIRLLLRKYYVDEIYDAAVVNPVVAVSREVLWKGIDVQVHRRRSSTGWGLSVQAWAAYLKNIQNGLVRSYAAWILFGAVRPCCFTSQS